MAATEYSEQDIQDYVAGTFTGDVQLLENYISTHPAAQKLVHEYSLLYIVMKQEDEPVLSFDLAEKVIVGIEERTFVKEPQWSRLAAIVAVLFLVAALVFCFNYFKSYLLNMAAEQGLSILSIIAGLVFVIGFHFVDLRAKSKKFASFPGYNI